MDDERALRPVCSWSNRRVRGEEIDLPRGQWSPGEGCPMLVGAAMCQDALGARWCNELPLFAMKPLAA